MLRYSWTDAWIPTRAAVSKPRRRARNQVASRRSAERRVSRCAAGRVAALGMDLAGLVVSESAGGEAAGSGGSGLQVVAAFPEPVEDFAVAGGEGHVEVGSRFGGGQVEDGVDQSGSGSDG